MPEEVMAAHPGSPNGIESSFPVALRGPITYALSTLALTIIDSRTGGTLATISPENGIGVELREHMALNRPIAPILMNLDGKDVVLAPFLVDKPVTGTQRGGHLVELLTIDAQSHAVVGRAVVDMPAASFEASRLSFRLVGAAKERAVLALTVHDALEVAVIDLRSQKETWRRTGFDAITVASDAVVGRVAVPDAALPEYGQAGLAIADGKVLWNLRDSSFAWAPIVPAGPHLFALEKGSGWGQYSSFELYDAATGEMRNDVTGTPVYDSCLYDDLSIVVCHLADRAVGAFEATTGESLWDFDDSDASRIAPQVTATWHGAVYGHTGDQGVILDARTGADWVTDILFAPYALNGHVAISFTGGGRPAAVLPTG
ncbi:hypothetical protein AB0I28_13345 [Phytomonospora sp. NPDC050363]|uniref:hypothetical protein n=1 Tax=Phytomonospora sp. NPDC050363 TaxID=3155642 RepID=UPI0033C6AA07